MIRLNNKTIPLTKFPDGTFSLRVFETDPNASAVFYWKYEGEEEVSALFYAVSHLRHHGVRSMALVLPYVPNARMDRVRHGEEVFTLRYFADFINMLKFDSVSVLDPHSNVTPALIERCRVISPEPYIRKAMSLIGSDNLILFYPDEGAMKRYSDMIKAPYGFGIKRRCWETGEITGFNVVCDTKIKDKNALIVDDICCRGGTFFHSAQALRKLGAKSVSAFCSHCERSVFEGDLLRHPGIIDRIYTTDSFFSCCHEKITVFKLEEVV